MAPTVFGYQHILYLLISVSLMIISIIIIKKFVKCEKLLSVIIRLTGFLLLVFILWNRIGIARTSHNVLYLIPNSFCGMSSFVMALAILLGKKDNIVLHCVMYLGLIGGTITMIYPDFIGQDISIFYTKTISGLLHHTFMVYLFYLTVFTGWFKPTIKKWYAAVIGAGLYVAFGYFLIYVLKVPEAMEITKPILDGTIFYWYVMGPIFVVVYFVIVGIWEIVRKKKQKS